MALNGPPYLGLVHEREAAILAIQKMNEEAFSVGHDWTINVINVRLEILGGYWTRFQSVQRELLLKHSTVAIIQDDHTTIERSTLDLLVETKAQMAQLRSNKLSSAEPPPAKRPKVSDIRMSSFSGVYTEWTAWRSEYKAKVMDTALEASDKISVLLSSLSGEAAACAGRAERLDEVEFERIWGKLEKTYDNKYQQAYDHIMKIINIPPMANASATHLRAMIDTTDEHLRMLQRFGLQTNHWSAIVCVILLGKLDRETRNLWESKDTLPSVPDLSALFSHLEQRILAIRNMEQSARQYSAALQGAQDSGKQTRQQPAPKVTDARFTATRPNSSNPNHASKPSGKFHLNPCPMCADGTRHGLWKCENFRTLGSSKQFEQLRKWNFCEICLTADHGASSCTKGMCPNCKTGKHNSLICPQPKPKIVQHVRGGKRQWGRKQQ